MTQFLCLHFCWVCFLFTFILYFCAFVLTLHAPNPSILYALASSHLDNYSCDHTEAVISPLQVVLIVTVLCEPCCRHVVAIFPENDELPSVFQLIFRSSRMLYVYGGTATS